MFNHSCCCDPGNPAICDPFEDDCPSTVLFGPNTKCQATVDQTAVCIPWCVNGTDVGAINLYRRRSFEIEFDQCVLTRVNIGNTRFYQGQGRASVLVEEAGQVAGEEFQDCYGGQTILQCAPYQASYRYEVDSSVVLYCDNVFGTFEQFTADPCVEPPAPDDIGYVVLIASSCYGADAGSRFYYESPQDVGGGRRECQTNDAYLRAPRSGWAWYAFYKAQDCIIRQPLPLVWKRYYGGFANIFSAGSIGGPACAVIPGTVFSATDSDFAVRKTAGVCEFDWERNTTASAVLPGTCIPAPFATFGEVATCAQVLSGSCQQTSVQMDIPTIT
jgi:hypothetical protein